MIHYGMPEKPQSFESHTKWDPWFHFFLAPLALIFFFASVYELWKNPSWTTGAHVLMAVWAIVFVFKMRIYSLKVQDRVIRLEERLRMERLLTESMKARIPELTERQLIALRFASDGELAGIVEKTLSQKLDPKQIKQAIQSWRPDFWRV
jgi:hypothetical protein